MYHNKKKIIILIVLIFLVIVLITGIILFLKNRTIDVSSAIHAVIIDENVNFYQKPQTENVRIHKQLELGTHVYVLEEIKGKDGRSWSKVVIDNKRGYILTEKLDSYKKSNGEMLIMADVSKFNKIYNFDTSGEFAVFLVENNIDCVYIRAGGRGYGKEGNFYYDECTNMWADECEFLKIPFGFYFLDEALNTKEINEEVEFIKEFITENPYEYAILPVALDVEKHDEKGRADEIWDERADLVSRLIKRLKNEDIETIVYSNAKLASEYLSSINTKFWLAYYPELNGKMPECWYSDLDQDAAQNEKLMKKMIAWQFTENGVGNIISDSVDISLVYSNFLSKGM